MFLVIVWGVDWFEVREDVVNDLRKDCSWVDRGYCIIRNEICY